MTHAVLSDDESDHENGTNLGQRRYVIIQEEWRSDELTKWLRMIDLLACGEKWDGRNVARKGNGRRIRVMPASICPKGRDAVLGLPENCYNPSWLKKLKGYEREHLNVTPAIDMTFTEEERACVFLSWLVCACLTLSLYRLAAQYIPLAKGESQPSTNPNINHDTSHLDDWLLYKFGSTLTVLDS